MYQLLRSERKPSLQLAHKIEKYTNGEVAVKKLLEESLQKKNHSYKEWNIQHELEIHEKRLQEIEVLNKKIKEKFDLLEDRLLKLEKERK